MNKKYHCQLPFALGATALLAGAVAIAAPPAVNVPTGAAAQTAGAINGNVGAAGANSAVGANGAANGNGANISASARERSGEDKGAATSTSAATSGTRTAAGGEESLGMWQDRARAESGENVHSNAAVGASDRGESMRAEAAEQATTAARINSASFDARSDLRSEIREQMTTGNKALAEARRDAAHLDEQGKTAFKASVDAVEDAEKQLKADLKAAKSATADEWPSVRSKLSADYAAYQGALATAQKAGEAGESASASGSESSGMR